MTPEVVPGGRLPRDEFVPNEVFYGPNGIRAGWRVLIFVAIVAIVMTALIAMPIVRNRLGLLRSGAPVTPALAILLELVYLLPVIVAAWIMTKIERRSFADYGLPLNQAFGKLFWQGLPIGFLLLSLLMGLISAGHGFSLTGVALSLPDAVKYGLMWGFAFLLTGFFEEFFFRGYLQSTITSGIGFWPAAIVLAVVFGASHLSNSGEGRFGALTAGLFGLTAAFSVRRTGNLWFAIGMHAAWDWGETFFYSVPDSGLLARWSLVNSSFHGPTWLTGGTVGPEGSVLVLPVLLIWAAIIHFMYPVRRNVP
jgi:uncharacterized protein